MKRQNAEEQLERSKEETGNLKEMRKNLDVLLCMCSEGAIAFKS